MFPANNGLRLQWIHCGRCNVSWFQALLVRLAGELTEIQDKRWRPPRRMDPCRTLLVLQAMSYKEPLIFDLLFMKSAEPRAFKLL